MSEEGSEAELTEFKESDWLRSNFFYTSQNILSCICEKCGKQLVVYVSCSEKEERDCQSSQAIENMRRAKVDEGLKELRSHICAR